MSEAKQVKILQRQKSPQQQQNHPKRRKGHQVKSKGKSQNKFGDLEDVIDIDVAEILNRAAPERIELVDKAEKAGEEVPKPVTKKKDREVLDFPEVEVTVSELSSTGDGLALAPSLDHVYVVPFTVPGDRVRVKVVRSNFTYSATDLLEVLEGGPLRDEKQINCQYFGRCSGCQLQMMGYSDQLAFKRRVIVKAYEKFSGLSGEQVPVIGETHGSPLTYGY
ncbi:tRNA(m5U54)methyltransferase, partial [Ascosphaera atra]